MILKESHPCFHNDKHFFTGVDFICIGYELVNDTFIGFLNEKGNIDISENFLLIKKMHLYVKYEMHIESGINFNTNKYFKLSR